MLLITGGRLEEPRDVVTELVTVEDEVVIGVSPSSEPAPPLDPVTPIATDEYDGEPFTTLADLLVDVCLDNSDDDASGNSCRLAGVGGLITPDEPPTFALPPDVFPRNCGNHRDSA